MVETQHSLVARLLTFWKVYLKGNSDIPGYSCDSEEDHHLKTSRWKRRRRNHRKKNWQKFSTKKKMKKNHRGRKVTRKRN